MKTFSLRVSPCFFSIALIWASIAYSVLARAETWSLDLKKITPNVSATAERPNDAPDYYMPSDQSFRIFFSRKANESMIVPGTVEQEAAFKRIVTKEPKYKSKFPFRGVVKLGSQEFAFALDAEVLTHTTTDVTNTDKKNEESKEGQETSPEKPLSALSETVAYNRLYFDTNRNGDLTDDKVIESINTRISHNIPNHPAYFNFPPVDVTIEVAGVPSDYAFMISGGVSVQPDFVGASVSFQAAVYREGYITLEGAKHHIVLIDFNSNGRFSDVPKTPAATGSPDEPLDLGLECDMLLVDPALVPSDIQSWAYVTSDGFRQQVSKLLSIDGRYYDLEVSPSGDKITLTPSAVPLGFVTNPHGHFRAVLYGDQGFIKIEGHKDTPLPVPTGEWKLLHYTINLTKKEEPNRFTFLYGRGTAGCRTVKVPARETIELPFGPPFTPVVSASTVIDEKKEKIAKLSMLLVGTAGELCERLWIDHKEPPKPEFTIIDSDGKVVQSGNFEYG